MCCRRCARGAESVVRAMPDVFGVHAVGKDSREFPQTPGVKLRRDRKQLIDEE